MKKSIWIAIASLSLVAFQNCSKAPQFKNSQGTSLDGAESLSLEQVLDLGPTMTANVEDPNVELAIAEYKVISFAHGNICGREDQPVTDCPAVANFRALETDMRLSVYAGNRVRLSTVGQIENASVTAVQSGSNYEIEVARSVPPSKACNPDRSDFEPEALQAVGFFLDANRVSLESDSKTQIIRWGSEQKGYLVLQRLEPSEPPVE